MNQQNNWKPLSKDTPQENGGVDCDMEVGPCACGAWHEKAPTPESILKKKIDELEHIIGRIHLALSLLCDDTSTGTNWSIMIGNAYVELQELRKFKQIHLDRGKTI